MDPASRFDSQRRFILQRARELLGRVARMDDEELRWTVRVLADCLPPSERTAALGSYSEHWSLDQLRRFLPGFIRRYTRLALADLRGKAPGRGSRLAELTDEELQAMPLAEKWALLAADPHGLRTDQLRRELARLFMSKSTDLFHDPGLSEAAVEFPAYHRVREALEAVPDGPVAALAAGVLQRVDRLQASAADQVEAALGEIRDAIGRQLGILIPVDQLFSGQMVQLPLERPDEVPEAVPPEVADLPADMSVADLATALLILTDLMSLREWEEYLLPLQRQYRSLAEIPPEDLRALLPRLRGRLGDRRITDFAERYRSGRMVAERKVAPQIWEMLPPPERLAILERDNRIMDTSQTARHLAKIFFSFRYDMLYDGGFHVDLLRSPRYQEVIQRLLHDEEAGGTARRLEELTQAVTRLMLELEAKPPGARPAHLQAVRALIAGALGLPDDLTYPAAKEGRA